MMFVDVSMISEANVKFVVKHFDLKADSNGEFFSVRCKIPNGEFGLKLNRMALRRLRDAIDSKLSDLQAEEDAKRFSEASS